MNSAAVVSANIINDMEEKLLHAISSSHFLTLRQLYHDSVIVNNTIGQTLTKTTFLEPYYLRHIVIEHSNSSEQEISLYGDTAVVSVLLQMKGKNFGFSFEGTYRYMRIWKLFGKSWMVVAENSNVVYEGSSGFKND